jgi:hypothetical protein
MRHPGQLTVLLLLIAAGRVASSQQTTPPVPATQQAAPAVHNDSACAYRSCALNIKPAWDGLAVVRPTGQRVATLHFFWPRDITSDLRGDSTAVGADSVVVHAERALVLRQAGAGFTDVGIVTFAVAVLRGLRDGRLSERDQILAGAGLGAIIVSVPLQFAADGELSRAVWWHNVRFAR